jgi:osmotically-inducible protein OsmY
MTTKQKWSTVAAVIAGAAAITTMFLRDRGVQQQYQRPVTADMSASTPVASDAQLVAAIRAQNIDIADLSVRRAGEIVVLQGKGDATTAATAEAALKSMGVTRVANMVTPIAKADDEAIRRTVERHLARLPGLDGCQLTVRCEDGVVSVGGTVQRELQKDAVRTALRGVRGPREVKVDLSM